MKPQQGIAGLIVIKRSLVDSGSPAIRRMAGFAPLAKTGFMRIVMTVHTRLSGNSAVLDEVDVLGSGVSRNNSGVTTGAGHVPMLTGERKRSLLMIEERRWNPGF